MSMPQLAPARPRPAAEAFRAAPPGRPWRRRLPLAPYLMILPFFLSFVAFGAYPLLFALRLSFTNWRGSGELRWIGFGNYTYLLTSSEFWASLANSGIMWLLVVPVQTIGAVAIAAALSRARLRGRGFFRTTLIIPFVTPLIAMAQVWILMFDADFGAVNTALKAVGLPSIGWLTTTAWAKPTIALLVLWKTTGFAIVIMLAAIQGIPDELYEAADIDGAGVWHKFWSITVPLLRRAIAFYLVIATLGISQMFAEPYVMTKGGPYNSTITSGLFLYNHITTSDLGLGAANSFLLVILVFLLSLVSVRLLRSKED
jgi:ABC-type sugar transport system permease subunit